MEIINKTKSYFFAMSNKIDKILARPKKKKKTEHKNNLYRN